MVELCASTPAVPQPRLESDLFDVAARAPQADPNPETGQSGLGKLRTAFDHACDKELLPMSQAETCLARQDIARAAAKACGLDPALLADWRSQLASEPTVANKCDADEGAPSSAPHDVDRLYCVSLLGGTQYPDYLHYLHHFAWVQSQAFLASGEISDKSPASQ